MGSEAIAHLESRPHCTTFIGLVGSGYDDEDRLQVSMSNVKAVFGRNCPCPVKKTGYKIIKMAVYGEIGSLDFKFWLSTQKMQFVRGTASFGA